jgi:hypothetical protein
VHQISRAFIAYKVRSMIGTRLTEYIHRILICFERHPTTRQKGRKYLRAAVFPRKSRSFPLTTTVNFSLRCREFFEKMIGIQVIYKYYYSTRCKNLLPYSQTLTAVPYPKQIKSNTHTHFTSLKSVLIQSFL